MDAPWLLACVAAIGVLRTRGNARRVLLPGVLLAVGALAGGGVLPLRWGSRCSPGALVVGLPTPGFARSRQAAGTTLSNVPASVTDSVAVPEPNT